MSSDTVYVLSMTFHGSPDGSMYLSHTSRAGDTDKNGKLDGATELLRYAKTFETEEEAWDYRCDDAASITWEITPMPRKRIFEKRLKG